MKKQQYQPTRREFNTAAGAFLLNPFLPNLDSQDQYFRSIKDSFSRLDTSYIGVKVNIENSPQLTFEKVSVPFSQSASNLLISAIYSQGGDLYLTIGATRLTDFNELENLLNDHQFREAQEFAMQNIDIRTDFSFTDLKVDGRIDNKYPENITDQACRESMVLLAKELEKL